MKVPTKHLAAGLLALALLASCNNPVSNAAQYQSGPQTPPMPLGSGFTLYAATLDGNGVLVYPNGGKNWTSLSWGGYSNSSPGSYYNYTRGLVFPPVNDVTVNAGVVYIATDNGLYVGSGSSFVLYLSGSRANAITVYSGEVYVSTDSGLKYAALAGLGSPSSISTSSVARQTFVDSSGLFTATSAGLLVASSVPPGTLGVAAASGYTVSGTINTIYHDTVNGTYYAGTPIGLSQTASPPSASNNSWSTPLITNGLGGAVNGIFNDGATLFVATAGGLSLSANNGGSWSNFYMSQPVYNTILGSSSGTYYFSNGIGGIGFIDINSGKYTWESSVLSQEVNVSKVYLTVP